MNERPQPRVPITGATTALSPAERNRAVGTILGAATGDALGAPFEFQPPGTYASRFPVAPVDGTEMVGGGSFGWAPGSFTDDTQMAIVLAEVLLDRGAYEADATFAAWRHWAQHAVDVGVNTRWSLSFPHHQAIPRTISRASAGNGALMRAFPLALAFLDATDHTVRDVVLHQASLTHQHPATGWGAWIAVEMMRFAILGDDPFTELPALVDDLPAERRAELGPLLDPAWQPGVGAPENGTVWGCLAQAVWALRTTGSYEAAVVAAVDLGDDADTVACVTGALAGARYGARTIPARWLAHVHGEVALVDATPTTYRVPDLTRLAERLLGP